MRVLLWLVLSLCLLGIAHAQNRSFVRTPEATIHFVHETKFDAENSSVRVGFFFQLEPHWHIYWRNPGDSGLPPKVDWVNSQSYHFSDFDWPTPKRIRINILANYGYDNEILLPLTVTRKSKETPQIEANLSWLVCKEECIPRQANLLLDPTKTPSFNIDFDKGQAKSLKRWEWKSLKVNEQKLVANLMVGIPAQDIEINEIDFFPVESGIIKAFHPPSAKVLSSENGSSLLQMVFESALNDSNRKIDSFYGILKVSSSQSYKLQK
ncbi:MAG: hypothetical protein KDD48_06360, partial [Bdellovibrionales bacterium]|nr:hypothetical protein [Bdellovibrionales bacterium]